MYSKCFWECDSLKFSLHCCHLPACLPACHNYNPGLGLQITRIDYLLCPVYRTVVPKTVSYCTIVILYPSLKCFLLYEECINSLRNHNIPYKVHRPPFAVQKPHRINVKWLRLTTMVAGLQFYICKTYVAIA